MILKSCGAGLPPVSGVPSGAPNLCHGARRGFTLVEVSASLAVMSVLLLAVGSAVTIMARALPEPNSSTTGLWDAQDAVNLINGELAGAITLTELTPTAVTFTTANRNGDNGGANETIRYYWTGASGGPLRRVYNGVEADLVPNVQSFSLGYLKNSVTTTTTSTGIPTTSPEQVLASFSTYSSGTTGSADFTIQAGSTSGMKGPVAESFFISNPPASLQSVQITRVVLQMKGVALGLGSCKVSIASAGSSSPYAPTPTTIGTPVSVTNVSLGSGYAPVSVPFSDVSVTDATKPLSVVVKGTLTTPCVYIQYLSNTSGPADTTTMFWSNNNGSGWLPSSNTNQQDVPFTVYGTYTTTGTTQTSTTTYYLKAASISLSAGPDSSKHADTSVQVLNQPQVSGP